MGFFWWLELGKAPKQAYFIETPKQGVFVSLCNGLLFGGWS